MTAREWEADVCDLFDVSEILGEIVDSYMHPDPGGGYTLTNREARHINFLVSDLHRRLGLFRDGYYDVVDGQNASRLPA